MSESPDVRSIMELFDLPGIASATPPKSEVRQKEGRTAEESRSYGQQGLAEEDYEAAIVHFKKAIEQGSADAGFDLAATYESADMIPQAFFQYEKAKKSQKSGELFLGLSSLYKRYGKVQDALKQHESAIQAEPNNAFLHYKLAETLRNMNYRKDSKAAILIAVALSPDDAFFHYWLGDLLLEMRDFEEAGKSLQAAIELSPGDHHLFQLASISLWGQEKKLEAIRATRLASDLDADNLAHTLVLHTMLTADNQIDEAKLEEKRVSKAEDYDHDVANRWMKPIGLSTNFAPR